jgi:hypothetical protein
VLACDGIAVLVVPSSVANVAAAGALLVSLRRVVGWSSCPLAPSVSVGCGKTCCGIGVLLPPCPHSHDMLKFGISSASLSFTGFPAIQDRMSPFVTIAATSVVLVAVWFLAHVVPKQV